MKMMFIATVLFASLNSVSFGQGTGHVYNDVYCEYTDNGVIYASGACSLSVDVNETWGEFTMGNNRIEIEGDVLEDATLLINSKTARRSQRNPECFFILGTREEFCFKFNN